MVETVHVCLQLSPREQLLTTQVAELGTQRCKITSQPGPHKDTPEQTRLTLTTTRLTLTTTAVPCWWLGPGFPLPEPPQSNPRAMDPASRICRPQHCPPASAGLDQPGPWVLGTNSSSFFKRSLGPTTSKGLLPASPGLPEVYHWQGVSRPMYMWLPLPVCMFRKLTDHTCYLMGPAGPG